MAFGVIWYFNCMVENCISVAKFHYYLVISVKMLIGFNKIDLNLSSQNNPLSHTFENQGNIL
jgi:hypothetical protein